MIDWPFNKICHSFVLTGLLNFSASDEGVSAGARRASAGGDVVDDVTHSAGATGAGARVHTALVAAGAVPGAVGVHGALWSAAGVWVTEVVGLT